MHKAVRYKVHQLIFNKKKDYFEDKPKELWKALKSLGLPDKISSCEVSVLKVNKTVQRDKNLVFSRFKYYASNRAGHLFEKAPQIPQKMYFKYCLSELQRHYSK